MRSKNIYHNLITDENSFTEAFVNALSDDRVIEIFRNCLRSVLKRPELDFAWGDVTTQSTGDDGSRPDVRIQNDGLELLIESKLLPTTALTQHQPESYVRGLSESSRTAFRALVFVVPKRYRHQDEIRKRYESLDAKLKSNIGFGIVYWEDIVAKIGHTIHDRWVQDLVEIMKTFTEYRMTPMKKDDVTHIKAAGGAFHKLIMTIENTAKILASEGYTIKRYIDEFGYGFDIRMKGRPKSLVYVGIFYSEWAENSEPIHLGCSDNDEDGYDQECIDIVRKADPNPRKDIEPHWTYAPIPIESLVDDSDSGTALSRKILPWIATDL